MATIQECLGTLGLFPTDLSPCPNIGDEFKLIKKAFNKKILVCHPDKGGDAVTFRQVRSSFEVLRELFEKHKVVSFASTASEYTQASFLSADRKFASQKTPSYSYFAEAAEEPVPSYRVEIAKSKRSKCDKKKYCKRGDKNLPDNEQTETGIEMGEIRIGSLDEQAGTYSRWVHLACWRVPSKIWLGLETIVGGEKEFEDMLASMNEVLFCGLSELTAANRKAVVQVAMDKSNWAKLVKKKEPPVITPSATKIGEGGVVQACAPPRVARGADGMLIKPQTPVSAQAAKGEMVASAGGKAKFIIPVPGVDGCPPGSLAGKKVVLTGIFPEVGGGAGLELGKAKVKLMVESFGGKVTGSVSGVTDYLITGQEPGFSKVTKARNSGRCTVVSLQQMATYLRGKKSLEASVQEEPVKISSFSRGYCSSAGYNCLAQFASAAQIAYAAGTAPAAITNSNVRPKPPKKAKAVKPAKTAALPPPAPIYNQGAPADPPGAYLAASQTAAGAYPPAYAAAYGAGAHPPAYAAAYSAGAYPPAYAVGYGAGAYPPAYASAYAPGAYGYSAGMLSQQPTPDVKPAKKARTPKVPKHAAPPAFDVVNAENGMQGNLGGYDADYVGMPQDPVLQQPVPSKASRASRKRKING